MTPAPAYAELQVTTNYSFLRGGSHPQEFMHQAAALGHAAIAVTDRNSFAGIVRAHGAAKDAGIKFIVGVRLDLEDAASLLCFPADRAAYGRLAQLLTLGKRRAEKGQCHLFLEDLLNGEIFAGGAGQSLISIPPETPDDAYDAQLIKLKHHFNKNIYLSVNHLYFGDDIRQISILSELAARHGIPLVATNDVHYHDPGRRPLQDVITCIREHCTIRDAGFRLFGNAERHLKSPDEMARLFAAYPEAIANTVHIADRCRFSLDELRYEYPVDPTPVGRTPQQELIRLTWEGADERYPKGVPAKVRGQIEHEIELIEELGYAPYFLTIHDIVRFARSRMILCQGRGSAANSAVCYCLGITAVDPAQIDLLFERFVSAERDEPPDIDVDFEHERREEVIQYIYEKYGRDRAGLTATVITYRSKSALREVGKAMGLSEDGVQALSSASWGWKSEAPEDVRVREVGLDPDDPNLRLALDLAEELRGFPRHLSQHTGGFVITKTPLDAVVPIENAAMDDRTVIEWDKDDLDTLRMLKIDVLALGMLTCIRKAFDLIEAHHGKKYELATVPKEDPAVYDMLCEGDSVGVFQVESRAQMAMLPRLKPRKFYDLVIEVAIVRPGPIQGDMVHPYLRRRDGLEPVEFPSKELEQVLGKTLGVPLFQEQAMKIAIVAAGFTPSEADGLRRAMATFRRNGSIPLFRDKLVGGMVARGYEREFAERCFKQIEGFGDYGFPESHSASFSLLVYVSAWIKRHYPAAFACALLNSQPMGFYAPAQIVRDARDHGVEARHPDINCSDWDCTLEPVIFPPPPRSSPLKGEEEKESDMNIPSPLEGEGQGEEENITCATTTGDVALRLGLRQIKGFREEDADAIMDGRGDGYGTIAGLRAAASIKRGTLERLARGDAYQSLGLDRRQALWAVRGLPSDETLPLFAGLTDEELHPEPDVALPQIRLGEQVADDYRTLKLSLKSHPMALLRGGFTRQKMIKCAELLEQKNGARVQLAGLVLVRQRPGSAKGVMFVTLEDETGIANIIVWSHVKERFRPALLGARLMGVQGKMQRQGIVIHVVADRILDFSYRLEELTDDTPLPMESRSIPEGRRMVPNSRNFR